MAEMNDGFDVGGTDGAEPQPVVELESTEHVTTFLSDPNRVTLLAVVLAGSAHCDRVREFLTEVGRSQTESTAVGRIEMRSYAPPRHFDVGSVPFFVVSFNGATIGTVTGVGTDKVSAYLRKGNIARDEELERRRQGPWCSVIDATFLFSLAVFVCVLLCAWLRLLMLLTMRGHCRGGGEGR